MEKNTVAGFRLAGLKLDKKTSNANGQSDLDCGNLWQKFEAGQYLEKLPSRLGDEIYAVYFGYEGDHTQPFSYFIGCRVAQNAELPAGMDSLTVPAQICTRFTAGGRMPECISGAWKEIWNSTIPRAYQYDFERYDERSHDWSKAEVDLFISVR